MSEALALVIDLGTTGAKLGVATLRGSLLWHTDTELETAFAPDGTAVQDANAWWDWVSRSTRAATSSGAFDPAGLVAVGITGQWASSVPTDRTGRPVGDCIMWLDTRGATVARKRAGGFAAGYHPRRLLTWIRKTGGAPSLDGADQLGHLWFLNNLDRTTWDRADVILEPVDHLAMRFTGVAAASPASMTAAWLTDNRHQERLDYDDELLSMAGLDRTKLPPLRATGSFIGPVRDDVARELGLPSGMRVLTGLPDLHTATLGSGAVGDFETHLALSTTSWISCPMTTKKTDAFRNIATVPGLTADRYLVANNHETSGRCLHWLRGVLGDGDDGPTYRDLDTMAASARPGSDSVIFTPWLAGERSPVADRNARGGFTNVSLSTTRAELVRAVLEGVAYNNRWLHESVEKFVGRRLDPLRVIGGGSVSELWCQIHADVMDRTIEQVEAPLFAGLRGSALACGLASGDVQRSEIGGLVPIRATYRPDPANRSIYDALYREFADLYGMQKKMFARLNRTRG